MMSEMLQIDVKALAEAALDARRRAYVPYSHFAVGAALLCADGTVFGGCNIENAAYSPTNCAERTAIFSAVYQGQRDFVAIAVCGGPDNAEPVEFCPPCGVCRQVLREFCANSMPVYLVKSEDEIFATTLEGLLPNSFGPEDLG